MSVTTGSDILDAKVSVPSELRTAQWSALPVWIRERAFFMASVDRAEVLDAFRSNLSQITAGDLTVAEAREALSSHLDKLDYKALPGQEGTIKDLSTRARMNVALETNLAQVNGFARWARLQDALDSFPAQRFVRLRDSVVPRENWPERFADAVSQTTADGADIDEMAALVNHPCWVALSVFDSPYAPFDYNSGMGLEPMDRSEAEGLGLVPAEDSGEEHQAMMEPQDRGLNATLESSPEVRSEVIRTALADELQGLAKWDAGRLVFTDPNGTKPYSADEIADVVTAALPAGIPNLQADAVAAWAENPSYFRKHPGSDKAEDLIRFVQRTEPLPVGITVFRGESFETERDFLHRHLELMDPTALGKICGSGTLDESVARDFAWRRGPIRVIYKIRDAGEGRSIAATVAKVSAKHESEGEVLWLQSSKFEVLSTTRKEMADGILYEIELRPL